MKKPYQLTNLIHSNVDSVTIDIFDITNIFAVRYISDDEAGATVKLKKECCCILLEDGSEYVADLPLSEVLYLYKDMLKHQTVDAVKSIFKS